MYTISVADLLMVIYLMGIGYHDIIYMDQYYLYAHEWESSKLCTIFGITAVISSEVCINMINYIIYINVIYVI